MEGDIAGILHTFACWTRKHIYYFITLTPLYKLPNRVLSEKNYTHVNRALFTRLNRELNRFWKHACLIAYLVLFGVFTDIPKSFHCKTIHIKTVSISMSTLRMFFKSNTGVTLCDFFQIRLNDMHNGRRIISFLINAMHSFNENIIYLHWFFNWHIYIFNQVHTWHTQRKSYINLASWKLSLKVIISFLHYVYFKEKQFKNICIDIF